MTGALCRDYPVCGARSFNFSWVDFIVACVYLRPFHIFFFGDEIQLYAGQACSYTAVQRECLYMCPCMVHSLSFTSVLDRGGGVNIEVAASGVTQRALGSILAVNIIYPNWEA